MYLRALGRSFIQSHITLKSGRLGGVQRASSSLNNSGEPASAPTHAKTEERMKVILTKMLGATYCTVEDTSGGCGAFYRVRVVSSLFDGLSPLAQHRKVQAALAKDIGAMHGLTIETMTPAAWRLKNAAN